MDRDRAVEVVFDIAERLKVLAAAIGILLMVAGGVAGIGWVVTAIDREGCEAIAKDSGVKTRYPGPMTGCQIYINGRWIPKENWRETP